jgi:hypothetical protein
VDVRPFIGVTFNAGVLSGGYSASQGTLWGSGADGTVLFAFRAGLLIGRHELALEIAPFTDFWDFYVEPGPAFEANATYGYLFPLVTKHGATVSWPLRFGVGVLAGGGNTNANAFFELRADLLGLTLQTRHMLIDLHLPSVRYAVTNGYVAGVAVDGVTTQYLSFFFGSSVSYLF